MANAVLAVVNHGKLSGRYALHFLLRVNPVAPVGQTGQGAWNEFGHMSVFERYFGQPGVARNPVHLVEHDFAPILFLRVIAATHVDYVVVYVLAHDVPRAAAQAQALALADGVEPEAAVLAQLPSRLQFNNRPGALAQVAANEVVIVYVTRKQMPWLSRRNAFGRFSSTASSRTRLLGMSPIGNMAWLSCA